VLFVVEAVGGLSGTDSPTQDFHFSVSRKANEVQRALLDSGLLLVYAPAQSPWGHQ
jgi:hypothetical protein